MARKRTWKNKPAQIREQLKADRKIVAALKKLSAWPRHPEGEISLSGFASVSRQLEANIGGCR